MFLARRAAWQAQTADPSLPVGAAIAFSIYKLFDKRKKRAPEGDTSGRSHIWGAVGVTIFGVVLGSLVSTFTLCTVMASGKLEEDVGREQCRRTLAYLRCRWHHPLRLVLASLVRAPDLEHLQ